MTTSKKIDMLTNRIFALEDAVRGLKPRFDKIDSIANRVKNIEGMGKHILYHVSGEDPKYRPKDGRKVSKIREMMIREGLAALSKDATLTSRAVAANLIAKYGDLPGAYRDQEALRKQLNRKNPLI